MTASTRLARGEPTDWRKTPALAPAMFAALTTTRMLHELLWYLAAAHRDRVNELLLEASELARAGVRGRDARRRGKELRGAVLVGAHLRGADLRGADLRGASLRGAVLVGADLRGARLERADLTGADLRGARIEEHGLRGALFVTPVQHAAVVVEGGPRLARRSRA